MGKKVICPQCGTQMSDVTLGWKCPNCKGFIAMDTGKFYEHREKPFMLPQTNSDRLRTMPDDKLAAALISADFCTVCNHYEDGLCKAFELAATHGEPLNNYCMDACLKWLQQPVKEE